VAAGHAAGAYGSLWVARGSTRRAPGPGARWADATRRCGAR
jgi:hypothetical protein